MGWHLFLQKFGISRLDRHSSPHQSNRQQSHLLPDQLHCFVFLLFLHSQVKHMKIVCLQKSENDYSNSLTHPIQFLTGLGVFIFLCTVIIAFAEQIIHRQSLVLKRFQIKKELNKPVFKVLNLIFGNGFIFKILGSFALFLFSIVLPLACKYQSRFLFFYYHLKTWF